MRKGVKNKPVFYQLLIVIMIFANFSSNIMPVYANEQNLPEVEISETISDNKKISNLDVKIQISDSLEVQSVKMPDGSLIKKDKLPTAEDGVILLKYKATKNKAYDFVFNYVDKSNLKEIKEIKKSYKVTKLKNTENDIKESGKSLKGKSSDDITISSFSVSDAEESKTSVKIGANDQNAFGMTTLLSGTKTDSVWIGYRFTLPEKSKSGGTWSFINNSYAWLLDLNDDKVQAKVQSVNGNIVLEGKVLAKNPNGGNIVPGAYVPTISVGTNNLVNEETAKLKAESWVIGKEKEIKSAEATLTVESTSDYKIANNGTSTQVVSGYFNKDTGDFSLKKPADMSGYIYGRVFSQIIYADHESTSERLNPALPVSFDFTYKVIKKEKGKSEEETDSKYKPVLMAVKQADVNIKNSQLAGTPPIDDVTLGGIIEDISYIKDTHNEDYYRGGDYTFSADKNTVTVSAVLSKDNKDSGYTKSAAMGLFFVPLNENDSNDLERILQIECGNIQGTSYSGSPINDKTKDPHIV